MRFNIFQQIPNLTGKKHGLLFTRDEVWKTARRILTPTFSAYKLKAVSILPDVQVPGSFLALQTYFVQRILVQ